MSGDNLSKKSKLSPKVPSPIIFINGIGSKLSFMLSKTFFEFVKI